MPEKDAEGFVVFRLPSNQSRKRRRISQNEGKGGMGP